MKIYCCECETEVDARLTGGKEIYPHRKDLWNKSFWVCGACKNYVGVHKDSDNKALGVIPSGEIRMLRKLIHLEIDFLWKNGLIDRKELYEKLSQEIGYPFHTANIKSVEEGEKMLKVANRIKFNIMKDF